MFGWLKSGILRISEDSARKDIERILGFYSSEDSEEAAGFLVNAAYAYNALLILASKRYDIQNLDDILNELRPLEEEELKKVSPLILSLGNLRKEYMNKGTDAGVMLSNGFSTWHMTLRAYTFPSTIPLVRDMWKNLARGRAGFISHLKDLEGMGFPAENLYGFQLPRAFFTEESK